MLAACACTDSRTPVLVFHAASLSRVLGELEPALEAQLADVDLRCEPSGSQAAARKVAELRRPADLVLVADWRLIPRIMQPEHADWLVQFASNEIVLAHAEHSRYTDEVSASNWPQLLTRPDVRLGRADEHTAPIGFQTLQVWALAERAYSSDVQAGPGLAERLAARCAARHVVPDVAELVSLLESRAVDYIFVFRSLAEEHRLKVVRLPDAINLADPQREADYARARVPVRLRSRAEPVELAGAPVIYALTVPRRAPHREHALRSARFMLGEKGREVLSRSGFRILDARPVPAERVPAAVLPEKAAP